MLAIDVAIALVYFGTGLSVVDHLVLAQMHMYIGACPNAYVVQG